MGSAVKVEVQTPLLRNPGIDEITNRKRDNRKRDSTHVVAIRNKVIANGLTMNDRTPAWPKT
jgi:hypothetical protein